MRIEAVRRLAILSAVTLAAAAAGERYYLGNEPAAWRRVSGTAHNAAPAGPAWLFGGAREIQPAHVRVDAEGNAYVAGTLLVRQPFGESGYTSDCFLARLDSSGREVYAIYFGGSGSDRVEGMAVGSDGAIYITGRTSSRDFPVWNAAQSEFRGRWNDAFAAKFTPDGGFVYSTYLGGGADDTALAVAADAAGNAYVTGVTYSGDFPTTPGVIQPVCQSSDAFKTNSDAFLVKLPAAGGPVAFSSCLGGRTVYCAGGSRCLPASSHDIGRAVSLGKDGSIYVAGTTNSLDFPVTPGAFQTECRCEFDSSDAFVTRLNGAASGLIYSTCLGGRAPIQGMPEESLSALAVGEDGSAYVAGSTASSRIRFPTTPGSLQPDFAPDLNNPTGYISRLAPDGKSLVFSTLISGRSRERVAALALERSGGVQAIGFSESSGFTPTAGSYARGHDFYLTMSADGSRLTRFWLLPDATADMDLALDAAGGVYLLGGGGHLLRLEPGAVSVPPLLGVSNAAGSAVSRVISPGELISLYGPDIGPNAPHGLEIGPDGRVTNTLAGVQALIGGKPAPLTYVQKDQINAVVPFELYGLSTVRVELVRDGRPAGAIDLGLADAHPGVFRAGWDYATDPGLIPAAALNQDGTVNSEARPAPKGSYVSLFMTGLGRTSPQYRDGDVPFETLARPVLPVAVDAAGPGALEVQYAGQAPGLVAGVFQVNVRVPPGDYPSEWLSLTLKLGGVPGPSFRIWVGDR